MISLTMVMVVSVSCGQAGTPPAGDERLGRTYIDGTCGFSIQPPQGWYVLRQRVTGKRRVTLLRMVHRLDRIRAEEIALERIFAADTLRQEEVVTRLHHEFEQDFSNTELLSLQAQEIAGCPGGMLAGIYWHEGRRWLRLEAVLTCDSQRCYALRYDGPAEARQTSEPLFHLVLASLRLLEDRVSREELNRALEAGACWLSGIKAEDLEAAIVPEQTFKYEIDGKARGFMHIQQAAATVKKRRGIRVRERGWMFEPDGRVLRLQANMFASDDLADGQWKASVTMLVPEAEGAPAYLEIALEDGGRHQGVLITSQVYHMTAPATENPPLKVPPSYMPRAVVRMLPRLLKDLARPRRLAFTAFDHARAGMVIRLVEIKGEAKLPEGIAGGRTYLIEDREGLAGEATRIYVNDKGRVRLVETGDLRIIPAKKTELEQAFTLRVREAEREMARLEKEYEQQQRRFVPKRRPKTP